MSVTGIPLLEDAALTSMVQEHPIDVQETAFLDPSLGLHNLTPYDSDTILFDITVGDRALAQLVTMDSSSGTVAREAVKQGQARPMYIQEHHVLKDSHVSLMRAAGSEGSEGASRARGRMLSQLDGRVNRRMNWAWAKALNTGTVTYSRDGIAFTLTYNLPTLTLAGSTWDNAASTPVTAVKKALSDFHKSAGYPATHIFFNPEIEHDYLMAVTEWKDYVKASPELASGVLAGQSSPFRIQGINATWVPIQGQYTDDSGSLADWWDKKKLTLAALRPGMNSAFEWGSVMTEKNNRTGQKVAWSAEDMGDHKGRVTVYNAANGVPLIKDIKAAQILTIAS